MFFRNRKRGGRSASASVGDPVVLRDVVAAIVTGLDKSELDDGNWSFRRHYHVLKHPGLVEQLRPILMDVTRSPITRRFAIEVVHACNVTELDTELICIALDPSDVLSVRESAAATIADSPSADIRRQLRPLTLGVATDLRDQLKGHSLRALWPDSLSIEELFECLTEPKKDSFFGAYQAFIQFQLAKAVGMELLPVGLKWCRQLGHFRTSSRSLTDFAKSIIAAAWRHVDSEDVLRNLGHLMTGQAKFHDESANLPVGVILTEGRRRFLLREILSTWDDDLPGLGWFLWTNGLMQRDDVEWSVTEAIGAPDQQRPKWINFLRSFKRILESETADALITAVDAHPLIADALGDLFRATPLHSTESQKLRQSFYENQQAAKHRSRRESAPETEPEAALPLIGELVDKSEGKEHGGSPFSKGTLYALLTNVTYVGQLKYKDEVHAGEHEGIVRPDVWERVQTLLRRNGRAGGAAVRNKFGALLKGILFCTLCDVPFARHQAEPAVPVLRLWDGEQAGLGCLSQQVDSRHGDRAVCRRADQMHWQGPGAGT
jgi:hypothetical protein